MKFLTAADLHIDAFSESQDKLAHLKDGLDVLAWIFRVAADRRVDAIVFLGDLFHNRRRIEIYAYHAVFKLFAENAGIPVFLLLGNHDLWFYERTDVSSVEPLSGLPHVTLVSRPSTHVVAGLSCDFLPFTHDPIAGIAGFENPSRVLFGHIAVNGALLNNRYATRAEVSVESDHDMVVVSPERFDRWERVFLGHYHGAQRMGNVEYVGSPRQLSFGEAFQDKHVAVVDARTLETEYVANDFSPRHLVVPAADLARHRLENCYVRVETDDHGGPEQAALGKSLVSSMGARKVEFVPAKKLAEQAADPESAAQVFDVAEGDTLERFVQAVGTDGLDYGRLMSVVRDHIIQN